MHTPTQPRTPACPPQVRAGFQQALELVASEAAGEGAGKLPEPAPVAEAVEAALHQLFGEPAFFE